MTAGKSVALLRGINVGRAKRIAMADLRALVESLGYEDVRTLLNSGNIVFSVPAKAKGDAASRIEKAIETKLGLSSRVTVITAAELDTIVKENPLLEIAENPSRFLIAVLNDKGDRTRLEPLLKEDWAPDALALGERVAYMWCPGGVLESRLADSVGRVLRDGVTTRNWATILKLHDLIQGHK